MDARASGFDRFTVNARKVLALAHEAAARLNHGFVAPEHLLIGLLDVPDGLACKILAAKGIEIGRVRRLAGELAGIGVQPVRGPLGITTAARRVVERAVDEAAGRGQSSIGTEHLLLGLCHEEETVPARLLRAWDIVPHVVTELANISYRWGPPDERMSGPSGQTAWLDARKHLGVSLGACRQVVAIADSIKFGTCSVDLLSVELFESGFTVQLRLVARPSDPVTVSMRHAPLIASDDQGRGYTGGVQQRGSLWGWRAMDERWISALFRPAVHRDAKELRLKLGQQLPKSVGSESATVSPEFVIDLAEKAH